MLVSDNKVLFGRKKELEVIHSNWQSQNQQPSTYRNSTRWHLYGNQTQNKHGKRKGHAYPMHINTQQKGQ